MMVAGFECDECRAAASAFTCVQQRGCLGVRTTDGSVMCNRSDAAVVREHNAADHWVWFNCAVTPKRQTRGTIEQFPRTRLDRAGKCCLRHSSRRSVAAVNHCLARTSSLRRSGMMR